MPLPASAMKHLKEVGPARPADGQVPSASPIWRNANDYQELEGISTLYQLFERSAQTYPSNDCLGRRVKGADGKVGPYVFESYSAVHADVVACTSGLAAVGVQPKQKIGVFGANCPEWMKAMQACNRLSAVCVPLYDSLGENAIEYIIEHSESTAVFVASEKLAALVKGLQKLPVGSKLTVIVYWGSGDAAALEAIKGTGSYQLLSMAELIEKGKANPTEAVPPTKDDLATIMYTSGTTGDPKGVILTHAALVSAVASSIHYCRQNKIALDCKDKLLSYLPLAHIFDRVCEEWFLYIGGGIGYWQGDVLKLLDDLEALKPSLFIGVPRVYDRIYARVMGMVKSGSAVKRSLFNWGYSRKLYQMNSGVSHTRAAPFFDKLVFSKVAARLGGKVKAVVSGGAPLAPHVEEFLRVCFCAPVVQGYGLTETCACSFIAAADIMKHSATVGPPTPNTEFRLESVSEMGCDATSETEPKGEVLIRGPQVFSGYYKNEEMTSEVLEKDGWFHTGDIAIVTPEGALKIVDRKKNIFKLSQGEYVAVEKVESAFKKNLFVDQIWVYGNSFKSSLVSIVVPSAGFVAHCNSIGIAGDMATVCMDPKAVDTMLKELQATGKAEKLKGFEIIKALALEPSMFTIEEDLLTPTFKLKRPQMLKKFQAKVDSLYADVLKE